MAQDASFYCPRCGAPARPDQLVCARCGLRAGDIHPEAGYASSSSPQNFSPPSAPDPFAPDPFVPQDAVGIASPPFASEPPYASAAKGPNQRKRRGPILVLLLGIIVLGVLGYVVAGLLGVGVPGFSTHPQTQATVTTTALSTTLTYASVEVTLLNAQRGQDFVDDPNSTNSGMLRLTLQEHNPLTTPVRYSYYQAATLLTSGKASLTPTYVKTINDLAAGATRNNEIDFAIATDTPLSQLTLLLGTSDQAQMTIPLKANADMGSYQPKTVKLNGQMQYLGLNWTLTGATSQLSAAGQQAAHGMKYLTLTLSVDSTLAQTAITGSPFTYMRLKAASATFVPVASTMPLSFEQGVTGKTGTVSFQVPQDGRAFTLTLLPQQNSGAQVATTDFQLA